MSKITCGDFPTISLQVHSKTLKSQYGMTFGRKVDLLLDQIHNQKILSNKSDKIKSLNTEAFWGNNKKIVNTLCRHRFLMRPLYDFLQVFYDFSYAITFQPSVICENLFRHETYTKSFALNLQIVPLKKAFFGGGVYYHQKCFHFRRCDPDSNMKNSESKVLIGL